MDKSKPRQKIMYRLEIWINRDYSSEENMKNHPLSNLKDFLKDNFFGREVEDKPINP